MALFEAPRESGGGDGGGSAEQATEDKDSALPSLEELLGKLDDEEHLEASRSKLEVHPDAAGIQRRKFAHPSLEQLLWHASPRAASALAVLGPSAVVLPLYGQAAGMRGECCLGYAAHPLRAAGGILDREDLEEKLGALDPRRLLDELALPASPVALREALRARTSEELRSEVAALGLWRRRALARLRTLELRIAWSMLGIPRTGDAAAVRRAFKRRALELHPDKGGDADRFQLLQEMKDIILAGGDAREPAEGGAREDADDEDEARSDGEPTGAEEGVQEELGAGRSEAPWGHAVDDECVGPDRTVGAVAGAAGPERLRLEAARQKSHQGALELWNRAAKLTEMLVSESAHQDEAGGADAMETLKSLLDRFAASDLAGLRANDSGNKAEVLLRRFLEQGAEVLCAAAVLAPDDGAVVAVVEARLVVRLLAAAGPEAVPLRRRCDGLLAAVRAARTELEAVAGLAQTLLSEGGAAAERQESLVVWLLPKSTVDRGSVEPVRVELPSSASVSDLRFVAAQLFPEVAGVSGWASLPRLALCSEGTLDGDVRHLLEDSVALAGHVLAGQTVLVLAADAASIDRGALWTSVVAVSAIEKEEAVQPRQDDHAFLEQMLGIANKAADEALSKTSPPSSSAPSAKETRCEVEQEARGQHQHEGSADGRQLAVAESRDSEPCTLRRLRTQWDPEWDNGCAGARRHDGSAVFCDPCQLWVTVPPFDHEAFELHCEKAGHTDWID